METEKIEVLINSITDDEDIKQSLWIAVLEGLSLSHLSNHAKYLSFHNNFHNKYDSKIVELYLSKSFKKKLEQRSFDCALEFSVFILKNVGCSIEDISEFLSINKNRTNRIINGL